MLHLFKPGGAGEALLRHPFSSRRCHWHTWAASILGSMALSSCRGPNHVLLRCTCVIGFLKIYAQPKEGAPLQHGSFDEVK